MFSRNVRVPLFFVSVVLTMAKKKPTGQLEITKFYGLTLISCLRSSLWML